MKRFFIIGNPRSGTTLFRLMLNKHSQMVVPPEAGFLVWLYRDYENFTYSEDGVRKYIAALKTTTKIEHWNLDYIDLTQFLLEKQPSTYSSLSDCVYWYYANFVLKKNVQLFGDKNNYYLHHIDLLSTLYSSSKFIHIIRDGRSVAASYQGVMKRQIASKYAPKLPTEIKNIAIEWTKNINCIEESFEKLDNNKKITIRYEDLVLEPRNTLLNVCSFLGVDFEEEMLEYYMTTAKDGLEPEEYLAWKQKNLQPLQKDEVHKYQQLTDIELSHFRETSEIFLKKYGYIET